MVEVPKLEFAVLELILKRVLTMDSELPHIKFAINNNTYSNTKQEYESEELLFKIDRVIQM